MKKYLIRRNLPGAGKLTEADRVAIATRSVAVIEELGHDKLKWYHTMVTPDNLWCVYDAVNEEILVEHARRGQFPCDHILEITATFSPATAEVKV